MGGVLMLLFNIQNLQSQDVQPLMVITVFAGANISVVGNIITITQGGS